MDVPPCSMGSSTGILFAGTSRGRDAERERTWMYLQRVPRTGCRYWNPSPPSLARPPVKEPNHRHRPDHRGRKYTTVTSPTPMKEPTTVAGPTTQGSPSTTARIRTVQRFEVLNGLIVNRVRGVPTPSTTRRRPDRCRASGPATRCRRCRATGDRASACCGCRRRRCSSFRRRRPRRD